MGKNCIRSKTMFLFFTRLFRKLANTILLIYIHSLAYDADLCGEIAGTKNIHWKLLSKKTRSLEVGCTGIEFTDFSNGSDFVFLKGIKASNPQCIGLDEYTLTPAVDPLVINAEDKNGIQMTLLRKEGNECFTTHWISDGFDYIGYFDKNILSGKLFDHSLKKQVSILILYKFHKHKISYLDQLFVQIRIYLIIEIRKSVFETFFNLTNILCLIPMLKTMKFCFTLK